MTPTKIEIHAILYLDCDRQFLPETEVEALRVRLADHFRDGFDRMHLVAGRFANCTDCSVGVSVVEEPCTNKR